MHSRNLSLPATAFTAPGLLSADECAGVIARAEALGFSPTGGLYPAGYRDNDRLVIDDDALADLLWGRLAPLVGAEGNGEASGLNRRFRLCRYRGGQSFCVHRDGPYVPSGTRRSLLTCQVYLNDAGEMRGGSTRFFADASGGEAIASVRPEVGMAVVFDHRLWHDGEPVVEGTKWVLRTDVMFDVPAQTTQHRGYVWAACPLPGGGLATAGRDGEVRAFDADGLTLRPRWARRSHDGSVVALAATAAGVLYSAGRDGLIKRASGGSFEVIFEGRSAALSLAVAGDTVAASFADGSVALLPGPEPRRLDVHRGWAWSLCAAPRGLLASAGDDGSLVLIDPRSGVVARLETEAPLRGVTCADDRLFAGDARGDLHAFSLSAGGLTPLRRWRAHRGAVTCLAASGGLLASGAEDERVALHDRSLALVGEVAHDDFVRAVAWLPGGRLVSASYDGTARVHAANARPGAG
jgi:hypothetical protein